MDSVSSSPEGVVSMLDTDLYKLTMQSAVFKYFPQVHVTYAFRNRNPEMRFTRRAFHWLQQQIAELGRLTLSERECKFLQEKCPFLSEQYLCFLQLFRFQPGEHISARFVRSDEDENTGHYEHMGMIELTVAGPWVNTILYEVPLLALISEAYFKFVDRDWTYNGQFDQACEKGRRLIEAGCVFSEFGTRRRRDFHTLDLVTQGLIQASQNIKGNGKLVGTTNVCMALKYDLVPIGTIAHEWFMGVAAAIDSYVFATEAALSYWIGTFHGVLNITLTDTFGTANFLESFAKPIFRFSDSHQGAALPLSSSVSASNTAEKTDAPFKKTVNTDPPKSVPTYADVFSCIRQDSGDPLEFVRLMKAFYLQHPPESPRTIMFSDSLNVEKCIEYRKAAEDAGFIARFGVGTFLSNDFTRVSTGEKSRPLNIVIKLSSANGKPAIKISDNLGKNTGDRATIENVKKQLGYIERDWRGGDERHRWD